MSPQEAANLFIVGAPRSGTTSLYDYLGQHPDIFLPWMKEPHYFAPDLRAPWDIQTQSDYLSLFKGGAHAVYRGDGSTRYLQSRYAAENIRRFCPDARIVAILRNPVDQAYSLHGHLTFTGREEIFDFEEALAAEPERISGRASLPGGAPGLRACYRDCARYVPQLKRYWEAFGRDRVHVIIFDDFAVDPVNEVRATCEFLGLSPDFPLETPVSNAQRAARSTVLTRAVPRSLRARRVIRALVPGPVRQRLIQLNTSQKPRPPISPELKQALRQEFKPEVEELSELLGRDLTHWCAEVQRDATPRAGATTR